MASGGITAGLSGRYAAALFGLAQGAGREAFDSVARSLAQLSAMLAEDGDLSALIASPLVPRGDAERAVLAVADAAGFDPRVRSFLGVLARARRLASLPAILRDYRLLAARARGETTAEVTSAHPLSVEQVERLRDTLRARLRQDVDLQLRVDPAILGGLVVRIGSRLIDSSIATKLAAVGAAMKGL